MNLSFMTGLLALLSVLQVTADGHRLLLENKVEEARIVFEQVLIENPKDVDAMVGAGFAALRQERVLDALEHFQNAREIAPTYADATFGLALCYEQLGKITEARRFALEVVKLDPRHEESKALVARLLPITEPTPYATPPPPPPPRPSKLQVPFRVTPNGFQIRKGSQWQTIYLKGVNLGAALPGRFPTQFPGIEVYRGWLKEMADLGINVVKDPYPLPIGPPWIHCSTPPKLLFWKNSNLKRIWACTTWIPNWNAITMIASPLIWKNMQP